MRYRQCNKTWLHALYCVLIVIGVYRPAGAENLGNAELMWYSDEQLQALSYGTRYHIHLRLKTYLTLDQIQDRQTFEVSDVATGEPITFRHATYAGFSDSTKSMHNAAKLWGDFHPDLQYEVTVRYPDGLTEVYSVTHAAGLKVDRKRSILLRFADRARLNIEPMTADESKGIGLKFDFRHRPARWLLLTSDGELDTRPGAGKFQSSITTGLAVDYRYHYRVTLAVRQPDGKPSVARQYSYPIVLRLKPAEFETDQDLRLVDYALKAQLAFTLPLLDIPVLEWHAATGVNRPFFPVLILTGFTITKEIEDRDDRRAARSTNRWDSEILYTIPLATRLDFGTVWRAYYDIERGRFNNFLELHFRQYFTDSRKSGFEFIYQDGSLPPEFRATSSYRLGWTTMLF